MMGLPKIYWWVIGGLIAMMVLSHFYGRVSAKKINWEETFNRRDKIPYGTYLLFEELDQLFTSGEVIPVNQTLYSLLEIEEELDSIDFDDLLGPECYISIGEQFQADELSTYTLLDFISEGNHVFIAAERFNSDLKDTLDFSLKYPFNIIDLDSAEAGFMNPQLEKRPYDFSENNTLSYFSSFDTLQAELLAVNHQDRATLIRYKIGKGSIILCSTPILFTNFHFLHPENIGFIETSLSHIPSGVYIYWDEYYNGSFRQANENRPGAFSFILSQEALKWAFWLLLGAVIAYVLFEMKRKQRIIPIIKPLPNTTLDFTNTIGRLYFQQADHHNLALKKINIFLARIRKDLFLSTEELDDGFIQKLSRKSGIEPEIVAELISDIKKVRKASTLTAEQLNIFNQKIDAFFKDQESQEFL